MKIAHEHLLRIMNVLPSDYTDYGGEVQRWKDPAISYPDCSAGCKWAFWQKGKLGNDWLVCTSPTSPRRGLLTFEHQAGFGCFTGAREVPG